MRERPILFKDEMVREILAGRKTQTRRLVLDKFAVEPEGLRYTSPRKSQELVRWPDVGQIAPAGAAGDFLWVRETWSPVDFLLGSELEDPDAIGYRADKTARLSSCDLAPLDTYSLNWDRIKWRPSIHMPRFACRIRLKLLSVRAERLHGITTADIEAEGIHVPPCDYSVTGDPRGLEYERSSFALRKWRELWDSINKKRGYSWDSNPFVWVYQFKLLEGPR